MDEIVETTHYTPVELETIKHWWRVSAIDKLDQESAFSTPFTIYIERPVIPESEGVALLCAIGIALIILLRRKRRRVAKWKKWEKSKRWKKKHLNPVTPGLTAVNITFKCSQDFHSIGRLFFQTDRRQ